MAVDSPELAALPPAEVVSAAAPAAVAELALAPAAPAAGGAAAGGSGASGALGPVSRHAFEVAAAERGLAREQAGAFYRYAEAAGLGPEEEEAKERGILELLRTARPRRAASSGSKRGR